MSKRKKVSDKKQRLIWQTAWRLCRRTKALRDEAYRKYLIFSILSQPCSLSPRDGLCCEDCVHMRTYPPEVRRSYSIFDGERTLVVERGVSECRLWRKA